MKIKRKRGGTTRPSVQPMATAALIDPVFKWLRLDESAHTFRALLAFHQAAGAKIRKHARAERLRGATLYVRVESSAWSQQLHGLKAELIDKLHQIPGGELVRDLRFTVGPLEEVPSFDVEPVRRTRAKAVEPPNREAVSEEIARAMTEIKDPELRDRFVRLFMRSR